MQTLLGSIIAIGVWENKGAKGLNMKLLFKVCSTCNIVPVHRSLFSNAHSCLPFPCTVVIYTVAYLGKGLPAVANLVLLLAGTAAFGLFCSIQADFVMTSTSGAADLPRMGCNIDCGWRFCWNPNSNTGVLSKQAHVR